MGDAVGVTDTTTVTSPHRLVVLASGNGSNLQAILDAANAGPLGDRAAVVGVITDRPGAVALDRANSAAVAAVCLPCAAGEPRPDYDARLVDAVGAFAPDLVVLAGWMRILSSTFLDAFPHQVINLHPARPGELPGTKAIERAYDEFRAGTRTRTGVMVHFVPDEGVDDGPVIASADVPIDPDDTLDTLAARVHDVEHQLLVDAITRVLPPPRVPQPMPSRSR